MKTTTLKAWGNTILFSFIISSTSSACIPDRQNKTNTFAYTATVIHTTYESMSTDQLQKEVEKYSKNGNLSFALGQELIKRWTANLK